MNTPLEPVHLHTPAGPAPVNNCTSASAQPTPSSELTSATDPPPEECADSSSDSASASDVGTGCSDGSSGYSNGSDYHGDDEHGRSIATSMSTPSTSSHCDRTEEIREGNKMDGINDDMTDPDNTRDPTAYQLHLKERLHLLAEVSGEKYQVRCHSQISPALSC